MQCFQSQYKICLLLTSNSKYKRFPSCIFADPAIFNLIAIVSPFFFFTVFCSPQPGSGSVCKLTNQSQEIFSALHFCQFKCWPMFPLEGHVSSHIYSVSNLMKDPNLTWLSSGLRAHGNLVSLLSQGKNLSSVSQLSNHKWQLSVSVVL